MRWLRDAVGRIDLRCGLRHTWQAIVWALPTSTFGLLFLTAPVCAVVLWAAEALLPFTGPNGGEIRIDVWSWPASVRTDVDDRGIFLTNLAFREVICNSINVVVLTVPLYRALPKERRTLRVRLLVLSVLLYGWIVGYTLSLDAALLYGLFDMSLPVLMILRMSLLVLMWVPAEVSLYAAIFPRERRLRIAALQFVQLLAVCLIFYAWRFVCLAYFRQDGFWVRVVVGTLAPPLLFGVTFEAFVPFSQCLSMYGTIHSAAMYMLIPMCFGMAMSTTLQLGSTDVLSGACIEFGSVLLEVNFKYALLAGETPVEQSLRWARELRTTAVSYLTRRTKTQSPALDSVLPAGDDLPNQPEQAWTGEDGDGETEMAHAGEATESTSPDQLRAQRKREVLATVAIHANIAEVTFQIMFTGFFLLARINPNEAFAPPVPPDRVLTLFAIRLALEFCTDLIVASIFAAPREPTSMHRRDHLDDRNAVKFDVCFISLLWAMDTQVFLVQSFCPFPGNGGGLHAISGLLGAPNVLSLGHCG